MTHLGGMHCLSVGGAAIEVYAALSFDSVYPDFTVIVGEAVLTRVVGAFLTYGLMISAGMLIVSGAAWAVAASTGRWRAASSARIGMATALCGALITGAAPALVRWLLQVGASL